MPRIRGIGDIDWEFPRPCVSPYTYASQRVLSFRIELNELLFDIEIPSALQFKNGRLSSGSLAKLHGVSLKLASACRKLSEIYPEGVAIEVGGCGSLNTYLRITTKDYEPMIKKPTRFLESLASKMTGWARMKETEWFCSGCGKSMLEDRVNWGIADDNNRTHSHPWQNYKVYQGLQLAK